IPGFEDQMCGMTTGESKRICVVFPENYHAQHLAGKSAEFDVTIKSVVRKTLAPVDDDLALIMGYENVEEMRTAMMAEAQKTYENNINAIATDQITDQLLEKNKFDLPRSLLESE